MLCVGRECACIPGVRVFECACGCACVSLFVCVCVCVCTRAYTHFRLDGRMNACCRAIYGLHLHDRACS